MGNHTILYDRPTGEWLSKDILNYANILMGNCDVNIEGYQLSNYLNVSPWIFWQEDHFYENFINNTREKYIMDAITSILLVILKIAYKIILEKILWSHVIDVSLYTWDTA